MALPGYEDISDLTAVTYAKRNAFVSFLKRSHPIHNPITGFLIGQELGMVRSQVAALRRACWKDGITIGSGMRGYFYAHKRSDLQSTLDHIEARERAEMSNRHLILGLMRKLDMNQSELDL